MSDARLVTVLAGVFGALAALLALLGLLVTPVALAVAVPFGATAGLLWYHASGRLARDAAAGPRRDRRTAPGPARDRGASGSGPGDGGRDRETRRRGDRGEPDAAAYRVLGLEPGASDQAVRAAYRRRSKETHPDRGGDPETFRAVREAYERLGAP